MKRSIQLAILMLMAVMMATVALRHLGAVSTVFWRSSSYADFSSGRLDGISLSREGRLSIAPALRPVFESGEAMIWTAVADAQGDVYLATGHRGHIYRLTPAMLAAKTSVAPEKALLFTAPESEIFALAIGPDRALYAGTAPDGKVYRITADGHSSVYFDPHAHYIWSLAFSGPTLYVGTGEQGIIYRVTAAGQGSRFIDTRERQIMTLAVAKNGDLLAGTEPGGLVFRIRPDGHAFVLYRSDLKEIHRLDVAGDGSIYVTAQGGSTPRLAPHPAVQVSTGEMPRATAHISVTVQGSAGQKIDPNQQKPGGKNAHRLAAPSPSSTGGAVSAGVPGADSAIYRIAGDGSVDTLWNSHEANADDVLPSPEGLLFSTDDDGAIFQLGDNRSTTVLVQTRQEETTRLLRLGNRILATTRNLGNLYEIGTNPAESGSFVSSVHDAGGIAHWGDITWRASQPHGSGLELFTRSGNSPQPDFSWSDWSPAYSASGSRVTSPAARYIQWKAVLHSRGGQSPVLSEVVIPYLPANRTPQITAIHAVSQPAGVAGAVNYVTGPNGTVIPAPGNGASAGQEIHLSWAADDPDNDALRYDVYFQSEGQTRWNILRRSLSLPTFDVTSRMLPDGAYRFKVVASDADANPPGMAKSTEMVSAPVTLDTTPPTMTAGAVETPAAGVAVAHFSATDQSSPLQRAEYSIDGGRWRYTLSDRGIIDTRHESFTIRAEHLTPGEHLLMLRVYDESGNFSAAKALAVVK